MKRVTVLAALAGLVMTGCLQQEDKKSDPSTTIYRTCTTQVGSEYACIEFDSSVSQADIASACSSGTLSAEATCATNYGNFSSNGKCAVAYSGVTMMTYRFYSNSAAAEQVMCDYIEDQSSGATVTWTAD